MLLPPTFRWSKMSEPAINDTGKEDSRTFVSNLSYSQGHQILVIFVNSIIYLLCWTLSAKLCYCLFHTQNLNIVWHLGDVVHTC